MEISNKIWLLIKLPFKILSWCIDKFLDLPFITWFFGGSISDNVKSSIFFTIALTPLFWFMLIGSEFSFSGIRVLDALLISAFIVAVIGFTLKDNEERYRKDKRSSGQTGPGSDIQF